MAVVMIVRRSGTRRRLSSFVADKLIEGKVARILNSRELVINRGSAHGVETGMIFEVLDPMGSEIQDPDTGEVIGSVHRPKVPVKVLVVEENLAVASTYRTRTKNVGGDDYLSLWALGSRRQLQQPPKWVEVPETFKSNEAAWESIRESESYVKVGDPVRQRPPGAVEDPDAPDDDE